jgi:hypothetical protein
MGSRIPEVSAGRTWRSRDAGATPERAPLVRRPGSRRPRTRELDTTNRIAASARTRDGIASAFEWISSSAAHVRSVGGSDSSGSGISSATSSTASWPLPSSRGRTLAGERADGVVQPAVARVVGDVGDAADELELGAGPRDCVAVHFSRWRPPIPVPSSESMVVAPLRASSSGTSILVPVDGR